MPDGPPRALRTDHGQGRKSRRRRGRPPRVSCWVDLNSQGFDAIAEASKLPDHTRGACSLQPFAHNLAAFLVADPSVQDYPDQPTEAIGNCPDSLIVSQAFRVIYQHSHDARSPIHIIEQTTGWEVGWINRYLDREYVRRLADSTLRTYAYNLLHFVRWWESIHHTGDIVEGDLTESTLLDYVRFQSSQQPRPSASLINDRVAVTDRALRNQFPNAPCQVARGFHQAFLRRGPMGLARPRQAINRLRVRVPKRNIVPLSVNEVARFWSSFRTSRDLAIVGLMLLQGLRSAEVMALNRDDVLLAEAQLRVLGKGNKLRFLPLAPESIQLLDHYLRLERPNPCSPALFVSLKGPARGTRMSTAGLRSLFRYHRRTTGIQLAHPHRFRHTFASDMVRAGISLPALMQLMGHADIKPRCSMCRSPHRTSMLSMRAQWRSTLVLSRRFRHEPRSPPAASASSGAGLRSCR
jgi:integrase/recombinase XerD